MCLSRVLTREITTDIEEVERCLLEQGGIHTEELTQSLGDVCGLGEGKKKTLRF